jgi:hypothetical protein
MHHFPPPFLPLSYIVLRLLSNIRQAHGFVFLHHQENILSVSRVVFWESSFVNVLLKQDVENQQGVRAWQPAKAFTPCF